MIMIYAEYRASSIWDLDDICQQLDITRDAVVDYYVKWDALFLTYRDADGNECEEEFEPNMFQQVITLIGNDLKTLQRRQRNGRLYKHY